ncbi:MAG: hypothetical protein ACRDRJ_04920 [Streptosporangiaceae bacterium]
MKSANLAVKFLLELAAFAAFAYWGARTRTGAARWPGPRWPRRAARCSRWPSAWSPSSTRSCSRCFHQWEQ